VIPLPWEPKSGAGRDGFVFVFWSSLSVALDGFNRGPLASLFFVAQPILRIGGESYFYKGNVQIA